MNIDNLHDALNLLDDELIEEVEVLRNERNHETQRHMRKWVTRWARVAAGLLLCFVSVYAVGSLFLKGFGGNKKSDTSAGESAGIESENKGDADDKDRFEQVTDGSGSDNNTSTGTGESTSDVREIKVEVTELINAGFIGVIKESADTETYSVGKEVTILLVEKDSTGGSGAIDVQHLDDELIDVAFPVGSVVIVRFMNQDVVDAGSEEIMLYADSVTFEENE